LKNYLLEVGPFGIYRGRPIVLSDSQGLWSCIADVVKHVETSPSLSFLIPDKLAKFQSLFSYSRMRRRFSTNT